MQQLNLIPAKTYVYYLLLKYRLTYEDYDAFESSIMNPTIDLKPYEFTMSLQSDKEIQIFKTFLSSYLEKSNMPISSSDDFNSMLSNMDKIDYITSCIICMQYYFI